MIIPKVFRPVLLLAVVVLSVGYFHKYAGANAIAGSAEPAYTNWVEYNGDGSRSHYSPLKQVNLTNIGQLEVAWQYSSGGADVTGNRTQMQCNPIIINGVLYGVNANTQAFAINASTGKALWTTTIADNGGTTSRGLTYFASNKSKKIFFGASKWLYAIDAETGNLVTTFGDSGRIDLKIGIERPGADNYVVANTPNTIFKNLIITGTRVSESETALLGDVRAYDANTGKLVWTFRTIPAKGDPGYNTWSPEPRKNIGGANCWSGMAIDRERGIVYIPTGSAAFDFYGGNRVGDNLYANCLLALDASTGKHLWHYQLVHHDVWDRDPPAPPNLVTVTSNGKKIDAVALVTKIGYVFIFNRVTGEPLFKIEEKAFRQDAMTGEQLSLTQPIPTKPAPFTRQSFTENDLNSFAANRDSLLQIVRRSRTGSPYIPITNERTIIFPGTDGGAQWGGAATDPGGILYVPSKEIVCYTTLVEAEKVPGNSTLTGLNLYNQYCSSCHGKDRSGNHDGSYPSLLGIGKRLPVSTIQNIVSKGKGMMPSFSHVTINQRKAIINLILNKKSTVNLVKSKKANQEVTYQHTGYNRWYDKNGYPVNAPPWGTLTAIDLNTGEHKWRVLLGEHKALLDKGLPPTGSDNYGGPLVTAGGLIFIAATSDEKFRAINKETGEIVWQTQLPAGGYATPSTYAINGKQYVVIACGGGKLRTKSGDKYVAFSVKE